MKYWIVLTLLLFAASSRAQQTTPPPEVAQLRMAAQCVNIYEGYITQLSSRIDELLKKCGDACKETKPEVKP
jgi:hypothetical protein